MSKTIIAALAGLVGIVFVCAGGLGVLFGAAGPAACTVTNIDPTASAHTKATVDSWSAPLSRGPVSTVHATWLAAQVQNAAIIVAVGANESIPPRGWVVAVATAMQESGLRNLGNLGARNDHDSLGLFQQRPSQGWGTPRQITDPVYAASKFYAQLITIAGWQTMALSQAAQAVQHSAYPTAYAKWESDATQLVTTITGPVDLAAAGICAAAAALPSGWTLPPDTPQAVVTAVAWALQQLGTPYHWGGDCTASRSGNPAHECDCSSLVQQAYKAAGIALPRTADQQSRFGQLVRDPSQLKPGDLVFIVGAIPGSRRHPGHVGMYLGNGRIIEAPQAGQNVKIVEYGGAWITTQVVIRRQVPPAVGSQ